jgi:predicted dehydrogenase
MGAEQVRWGILGSARIALRSVLPAFRAAPHAKIVAIAARDPHRARETAQQFGIERIAESYEALIADPALEAIYVPLPNDLHAPWTLRALAAGKHVLCEKPIALDAAQTRAIAAAAREAGRYVAEAYMIRFHPQWRRAVELATSGELGDLLAVQCWFAYDNPPGDNLRNDPVHGGGGLYDIGGYALVAGRLLFADDPVRLIGMFERDAHYGVDRLTSGLVAFPRGRHLSFGVSTRLPRLQSVVAYGTRARLVIETPFNPLPDRSTRIVIDDGRDLYGSGARVEMIPPADQYAAQLEAFSVAILTRRPPEYGIEDALVNMRSVDALFRSEQSGTWEAP